MASWLDILANPGNMTNGRLNPFALARGFTRSGGEDIDTARQQTLAQQKEATDVAQRGSAALQQIPVQEDPRVIAAHDAGRKQAALELLDLVHGGQRGGYDADVAQQEFTNAGRTMNLQENELAQRGRQFDVGTDTTRRGQDIESSSALQNYLLGQDRNNLGYAELNQKQNEGDRNFAADMFKSGTTSAFSPDTKSLYNAYASKYGLPGYPAPQPLPGADTIRQHQEDVVNGKGAPGEKKGPMYFPPGFRGDSRVKAPSVSTPPIPKGASAGASSFLPQSEIGQKVMEWLNQNSTQKLPPLKPQGTPSYDSSTGHQFSVSDKAVNAPPQRSPSSQISIGPIKGREGREPTGFRAYQYQAAQQELQRLLDQPKVDVKQIESLRQAIARLEGR